MATNLLNARLVMKVGGVKLLRIGLVGSAVATAALVANATTGFGGLVGLAAPLFLFVGITGLIVANSIAGAMAAFPERAGAVSALVGALQYGAGIAGSALVGAFANGTPIPMALVIGIAGIGGVACAFFLVPSAIHEPQT